MFLQTLPFPSHTRAVPIIFDNCRLPGCWPYRN